MSNLYQVQGKQKVHYVHSPLKCIFRIKIFSEISRIIWNISYIEIKQFSSKATRNLMSTLSEIQIILYKLDVIDTFFALH